MSKPDRSTVVITLTKEAKIVAKLQRKHEEYAIRYKGVGPETHFGGLTRMRLLGRLLDFKRIEIATFEVDCREGPGFDEEKFWSAVMVIDAYNKGIDGKTPGSPILGGTGLK